MTTTIEDVFGSRLMSDGGTGKPGGFLLNNELTDFSFAPADAEGKPIANRVQPGKRPRSSMSPTLVFDERDGKLADERWARPGGAADHPLHREDAARHARVGAGCAAARSTCRTSAASTGRPWWSSGRFPPATLEALRARGHTVNEIDMTSGLQAIQRSADRLASAAPTRGAKGVVRGD